MDFSDRTLIHAMSSKCSPKHALEDPGVEIEPDGRDTR